MKVKKEKPVGKKSGFKLPLGFKMAMIALLMAIAAKAGAIEREGIITQKRYNGTRLEIFVDTDPNIPGAERIIEIPTIKTQNAVIIDEFAQPGVSIRFEDRDGVQVGRYIRHMSRDIISIDGHNVLTLVGNNSSNASFFRYAAAEQNSR